MSTTEVGSRLGSVNGEHARPDNWVAASEGDIALCGLEARLKAWVAAWCQAVDMDHEAKMWASTPTPGVPVTPNPWPARFEGLVVLVAGLVRELAHHDNTDTRVSGAIAFREAYDEAVSEVQAMKALAARPPLDFAKIAAKAVPPAEEWFDREHELDAEGRQW